jgi:hypothetical protein
MGHQVSDDLQEKAASEPRNTQKVAKTLQRTILQGNDQIVQWRILVVIVLDSVDRLGDITLRENLPDHYLPRRIS